MRFFSRIKIISKLFVTRGRVGLGGGDGDGVGTCFGWAGSLSSDSQCSELRISYLTSYPKAK